MTTGTQIVAAVLDTHQLILYQPNGETICLPQGDKRIRPILKAITPIVNAGGVATVDLRQYNAYADFEQKTGGLVKLFRVAKKAVAHLFGSDEERLEPMIAGKVPSVPQQQAALEEIMAHAEPVSSQSFSEKAPSDVETTMVAIVETKAGPQMVPGVERLKGQFAHSAKLGSTKGVENLLRRLGAVTEKRGHSVQDVLRFLEKGDLPIADDGSIIAYKILKRTPNVGAEFKAEAGIFFDCHSGRIPQRIGSYVRVAEDLVDRDRRNECSNGLHIARRGYLGNFPGDVCVLTKIAPEDVVTVPHGDPNKVRVCGYHILALIPQNEFSLLRSNKPMTESSECRALLAQAIAGTHVGVLEEVLVTGQKGSGVRITPVMGIIPAAATPAPARVTAKAVALDDKTVQPEGALKTTSAPPVNPTEVQKAPPSRSQQAAMLISLVTNGDLTVVERKAAADDLVALKKRVKVGYGVLGLSGAQQAVLEGVLAMEAPATPAPAPKAVPEARKQAVKTTMKAARKDRPLKGKPKGKSVPVTQELLKGAPVKASRPKAPAKPKPELTHPPVTASRAEKAQFYFDVMTNGGTEELRKEAATHLLATKKRHKLGWSALGLPAGVGKTIDDLIGCDN